MDGYHVLLLDILGRPNTLPMSHFTHQVSNAYEPMRPNQQRARTAIILIWVVLGMQVASDICGLVNLSVLTGGGATEEEVVLLQGLVGLLAIATGGVTIASAVTYIRWFRRAYYNLHLVDNTLRYSEGWAAGGWFVPILHYFRPVQIMVELYNVTRVLVSRARPEAPVQDSNQWITAWWVLWVISNLWGNLSAQISMRSDSLETLILTTRMDSWAVVLEVPLAIVAVKVIRDYSAMEDQLADVVQAQSARNDADGALASAWKS
jgi:hypothetical protein